jgi:hypothetical protein
MSRPHAGAVRASITEHDPENKPAMAGRQRVPHLNEGLGSWDDELEDTTKPSDERKLR